MSSPSNRHSVDQLKRALNITQQIEALEKELHSIFQEPATSAPSVAKPRRGRPPKAAEQAGSKPVKERKKRVMSEEARARIAEAQKKRWAKSKGGK